MGRGRKCKIQNAKCKFSSRCSAERKHEDRRSNPAPRSLAEQLLFGFFEYKKHTIESFFATAKDFLHFAF